MTQTAQTSPVGDGRIQVDRLTKKFGTLTAVDDLSFSVEPGRITFLKKVA